MGLSVPLFYELNHFQLISGMGFLNKKFLLLRLRLYLCSKAN